MRPGAAALACLLLACAPAPPPDAPDIVLIVVDTLRSDHLPSYGYRRNTAPALSALADEGVLFERVIAPSSWTKTSMASMMTGLNPDGHAVRGVEDALSDSLPTLATSLAHAGYATIGINTNPWLEPGFGFARGFDVYETHVFSPAGEVNRIALARVEELRRRPFLLYVHYMDVHAPYRFREASLKDRPLRLPGRGAVPDELLEHAYRKEGLQGAGVHERVIRLYDAGIRAVDSAIADLLRELGSQGALDNAIVAVTSDHGEAFREHGSAEHGRNLYPEVYEIPLILRWPGRIPAGARIPAQVRGVDLAPTLLHLAGVPIPPGLDGSSLMPFDVKAMEPRIAIAAVGLNDYIPHLDYVAVVSPDRLYIRERRSGSVEFYDLERDPDARHDLGAAHPEVEDYARLPGPGLQGTRDRERTPKARLDEPTRERLRALGYLDEPGEPGEQGDAGRR
ncbi:MAG: sulfatase [Deltaproteobacteria bacterium]|nr:sulfatase [Deltaproteobacteria bacterium]MBW2421332.1 sulfatase [Deltaproteobacteria bacterium]